MSFLWVQLCSSRRIGISAVLLWHNFSFSLWLQALTFWKIFSGMFWNDWHPHAVNNNKQIFTTVKSNLSLCAEVILNKWLLIINVDFGPERYSGQLTAAFIGSWRRAETTRTFVCNNVMNLYGHTSRWRQWFSITWRVERLAHKTAWLFTEEKQSGLWSRSIFGTCCSVSLSRCRGVAW